MLRAPYLIVGFDIDPATPNAPAILAGIEHGIPWPFPPPLPLLPNVYAEEVTTAIMYAALEEIATYLSGVDQQYGAAFHWFAQLCRTADIAAG